MAFDHYNEADKKLAMDVFNEVAKQFRQDGVKLIKEELGGQEPSDYCWGVVDRAMEIPVSLVMTLLLASKEDTSNKHTQQQTEDAVYEAVRMMIQTMHDRGHGLPLLTAVCQNAVADKICDWNKNIAKRAAEVGVRKVFPGPSA